MNIRPKKALLEQTLQRPSALASQPRNEHAIWLDKNENIDPELLKLSSQILHSISSNVLNSYPEAKELYLKLSDWVGVDPENILVTPGSDGVIKTVFDAFVGDGDCVIYPEPTFAMYEIYCKMFGAEQFQLEYLLGEKNEPYLDTDIIVRTLRSKKPKLFCLPNPDSPTGVVIQPSILKELLIECENCGTIMLIDEAYHPFYDWTAVDWTKNYKNLVVARTFSKAWGLAGLRIGYAVSHKETISILHKLRPMYEGSSIAIEFMARMLDHSKEMEKSVKRILEGKQFFKIEMKRLGFNVSNSEGNFIHVNFGADSERIHKKLTGKVLYRSAFNHTSLCGYSRFTVGPIVVMEKVVSLIRKAMGFES